jgi:predicted nucleic acid-binding protein
LLRPRTKYRAICPDFEKSAALWEIHAGKRGQSRAGSAGCQELSLSEAKGGTVRKAMNSLIAAFCIENDHQLLHNDSDFDG